MLTGKLFYFQINRAAWTAISMQNSWTYYP